MVLSTSDIFDLGPMGTTEEIRSFPQLSKAAKIRSWEGADSQRVSVVGQSR